MIIDRGRIIASGSPDSLRERWEGTTTLRVSLKQPGDGAAEALAAVPGVTAVRPGDEAGSFRLDCAAGTDPREEIFRAVVAADRVLLELVRERASLEDVFVRLTTGDETVRAGEEAAASSDDAGAEQEEPTS